jgi:hypothetical protein
MNRLCEEITTLERNKGAPPVEAAQNDRNSMLSNRSYKITGNSSVHMVRLKNMSEMLDEINKNNQVSHESIKALIKNVR